ncbi:MAG: sulfur carrier protein ThiS [Pseudomonadota bacterium]
MRSAAATVSAPPSRSIRVNGANQTLACTTLADVVDALGYDAEHVATAVDGAFVPRAKRADTAIADGAEIEIVAPRQGG